MNLETKTSYDIASKKPTFSVGTIVLGVVFISISIILTLFIAIPELAQSVIQAKWQILKGGFVGVTILPILLFVTLKGGKTWYKKFWSWLAIGITGTAIIAITLVSVSGSQIEGINGNMSDDMQMEQDMNMEGSTSEDMGVSSDVVPMG